MTSLLQLTIVLFALVLSFSFSFAQQLYLAKWKFSAEQTSDKEATLIFKVALDQGWHIYSQNTPDGGPIPTVFKFDEAGCYEPVGKVTEPAPHKEFDDAFGVNVLLFNDEVTF